MAKLIQKRGMVDPKEFDDPTIGSVVNKATTTVGNTVDKIAGEADLAKQRISIDLDRNKTKATDFDENPPEKKQSIGEKLTDMMDEAPKYPDPDLNVQSNGQTDQEEIVKNIQNPNYFYDNWVKPEEDRKKAERDKTLPAINAPVISSGGAGGSGGSGGSGGGSGNRNYRIVPPNIESGGNDDKTGPGVFERLGKGFDKIDNYLNQRDDADDDKYSEKTDRYAKLGGYTKKTWKTIKEEKQAAYNDYEFAAQRAQQAQQQYEYYRNIRDGFLRDQDELVRDANSDPSGEARKEYYRRKQAYQEAKDNIDTGNLRAKYIQYKNEEERLREVINNVRADQSKYGFAVASGIEIDRKDKHWRKQWAKPIAENTENMLGTPTVKDVTGLVGYGQMTGKTATEGINTLVGGYKTASGANEWTRTRVGDRQLVEALVNVTPNRMITPFGTPGTVGGSGLQNQFDYNTPLRRIGVGDVTARPGYILNIEDIHRKSKTTSPKLVRKKIQDIKRMHQLKKSKKIVPMPKDINKQIGLVKFKLQRPDLTGKNIVGGYQVGKVTKNNFSGDMENVGKTSALLVKTGGITKPSVLMGKGNIIDIQSKIHGMKKVTAETKPFKMNINAVGAITPKIVEMNLNNASVYMKKKKLVK